MTMTTPTTPPDTTPLGRVSAVLAAFGLTWDDYGTTGCPVHAVMAHPAGDPDGPPVVSYNWNPPRFPRTGEPGLSYAERHATRLADALESVGADLWWYDETVQCDECHGAIRATPDSYWWTPDYYYDEHCGGYVCSSCALSDPAYVLDMLADSADDDPTTPHTVPAFMSDDTLQTHGWVQYAPGDPRQYESGWHPGQDDDPAVVLTAIRDEYATDDDPRGSDVSVLFRVDSRGQFDTRWSAWVRVPDDHPRHDDDDPAGE